MNHKINCPNCGIEIDLSNPIATMYNSELVGKFYIGYQSKNKMTGHHNVCIGRYKTKEDNQ